MGSEPAGDGRGAVARGRRPAGSGTREAILAAAARAFAEQGYPRTTLRGIAKDAGVDTRLVSHYFGSKQELFVSVVELPFDPDVVIPALLGPGRTGVGFRLAGFAIGIMDTPEARQTMTGLLRAAASEEAAAVLVRDLLMERLLGPLAHHLGGDDPTLRASLAASQVAGMAFTRHVVGLPRLATASRDELVGALGPVLEHYLVGDLSPPPA
ncbi:MAG TPA: TetR family transcriptional regulator [Ornithinibacter sp.]|jgi:AcrR family transcriptional regulator|uniref:TetR/AcrR family transcriptional regulator n=1 Tax=Ornithinibacter sp. TaxID=2862748 RepID=UPI001B42C763|nr:TetR family transcriptional regulator [Ornithinibacter sp.]MBP6524737.1 TetR family transcriptional regulator [Dermatophilaceae bacterium]HOB78929.1 TetR family transcriptional regulator [Ornithinibacter sp.]HOT55630.1 TetR family transcriptional regulator [Ornithinibacter sp.]HQA12838.1 TetR family transcriptional regulator [Ornithinibacter sp.]HQD66998.1 TetR family transcriptional regulator [Ornithinibacter sp.]